ncbi:MAG: hypothetical protein ACK5KT_14000 [Dysgonomonas sp.]
MANITDNSANGVLLDSTEYDGSTSIIQEANGVLLDSKKIGNNTLFMYFL